MANLSDPGCWIRARARADSGISFVESILILALLMILLTLGVPGITRINQEWRLWSAVWLVEGTLQWGRMYCVAANTSLLFEVDPQGRRVHWSDPATGQTYSQSVRELPQNVRVVSAPGRPVRLFPRGNAAPAGTFVLRGEAGQFRIVINPGGRIRVQRD